jgi:hypothetical protein
MMATNIQFVKTCIVYAHEWGDNKSNTFNILVTFNVLFLTKSLPNINELFVCLSLVTMVSLIVLYFFDCRAIS